jgi:hypothetical protein
MKAERLRMKGKNKSDGLRFHVISSMPFLQDSLPQQPESFFE